MANRMGSKRAAHVMTFGHSNILKNVGMKDAKKVKTPKQLERHLKGVANHWRISILFLIAKQEDITVDQITRSLGGHFKTISEHTRRLVQAGLVEKKYLGKNVTHRLSPYGKHFYKFLETFQHS